MPKNDAVILAAGKGSRFLSGEYKLLAPLDGVPLIVRTLEPVLQAGFDEVIIVIGAHGDEMRRVLQHYPVRIVENNEWERGQSTSLTAGIRALDSRSERACLLLGDQPWLRAETLRSLVAASEECPAEVIVPFYEDRRGNPIVVPASLYGKLVELSSGDMGGRKFLQVVGYRPFPVEDPGVLRDVDTIEELEKHD